MVSQLALGKRQMIFTKMHGIGNDYIYVNGFDRPVENPPAIARAVSDRHFGIGGDGLVLVLPSSQADVRMQMFNADGSEGMMCGNAIRCVAKFAHEQGLARANPVKIETASGVKTIEKFFDDGDGQNVSAATVDMGRPILTPAEIPVELPGKLDGPIADVPLEKYIPMNSPAAWMEDCGLDMRMTCVSMGNPHVIIFCENVDAVPLEQIGPYLETQPIFPDRINVHFAQVPGPTEIKMRTWERGSGVTLACGTGASAVCVAAAMTGRAERSVTIHLPGGDLDIQWRQEDDNVLMTGPAAEVFSGEWMGKIRE